MLTMMIFTSWIKNILIDCKDVKLGYILVNQPNRF